MGKNQLKEGRGEDQQREGKLQNQNKELLEIKQERDG